MLINLVMDIYYQRCFHLLSCPAYLEYMNTQLSQEDVSEKTENEILSHITLGRWNGRLLCSILRMIIGQQWNISASSVGCSGSAERQVRCTCISHARNITRQIAKHAHYCLRIDERGHCVYRNELEDQREGAGLPSLSGLPSSWMSTSLPPDLLTYTNTQSSNMDESCWISSWVTTAQSAEALIQTRMVVTLTNPSKAAAGPKRLVSFESNSAEEVKGYQACSVLRTI
jgi:hypothetical protein